MKGLRLSTRLALINGLIPLVVLTVLGVVIRSASESILIGRADRKLDGQVAEVQRMYGQILIDPAHAAARREAAEKVVTDIQASLDSLPGSGKSKGSGYWPIRVLDLQGHAFLRAYARLQAVDEPWERTTFDQALAGHPSRIDYHDAAGAAIRLRTEPLRVGGKVLAVIQGAEPLTEVNAVLGRLDEVLLVSVPLAVALSVALGWLLGATTLRPARALARSVARVDSGNLDQRIAVMRDDEVGAIAHGFNGMLARLQKAFSLIEAAKERQRQFSTDISHELRNPLTAVQTNVSFALNDTGLAAESRRALESTLRAARTMARLVEDLLLIARAEVAPAARSDEIVELGSVLVQLSEQMARDGAAPIESRPGEPVFVHGDPDHLERIFRNLIDNALNHTPPEGRVTVGVDADEGRVQVTIEDNGSGIPAQHLGRVRERFFRVDPARSRAKGGTGLGLTICDSLLKACAGSLVLESQYGKGTRAIVSLPAFTLEAAGGGSAASL
jgi:signal transduction histidine kinase